MSDHYSIDDLLAHGTEPGAVREEHLKECADCRALLDDARLFEQSLADPLTWVVAEGVATAPASPPSALRQQVQELDRATERARELLSPIVVSPSAFKEADVEHRRMYHTPDFVRLLCAAAREVRRSQPQFALLLATAATAIVPKCGLAGAQQIAVEGQAWLERGIACGSLSRYRDGDAALARAEAIYRRLGNGNPWDLANVWLAQANIRVETERLDEAVELADAAANAYFAVGDVTRAVRARLVRASVLYVRGDFAGGVIIYEEVLRYSSTDLETRARVATNLANSYIGVGEYSKAIELFGDALARWDELGDDVERTRATWGLAAVEIARGNLATGIRQFEEVLRQFEALGITNDAAVTRLQLAEALLAAGRPEEVPPILRGVAVSFASEGMMRSAKMAVAYLDEALKSGTLTVSRLRYVRSFIENLPTRPASPFEAPA